MKQYEYVPSPEQRLVKGEDILIRAIPGEEWLLSYDGREYHLNEQSRATHQSYSSDSLHELLIAFLMWDKKVRLSTDEPISSDVTLLSLERWKRIKQDKDGNYEPEITRLLHNVNLHLFAIPGEEWVLRQSDLDRSFSAANQPMYYLIKRTGEKTVSRVQRYVGLSVGRVLLEMLTQNAEYIERSTNAIILDFQTHTRKRGAAESEAAK